MATKRNNGRRGARSLTPDEVNRIFALRAEGKSPFAIHKATGHHRATIDKYLKQEVEGHPQTPINEAVQKLRTRMMEVTEFDLKQSLLGDLVLIDEYRDKMAENVAAGRVPDVTDAGELKKLIDAKATLTRLPQELGRNKNDLFDQIRSRIKNAMEDGMEIQGTDFQVLEEQATDSVLQEEEPGAGSRDQEHEEVATA